MPLIKDQKITLIGLFGAAILAALLGIGIREYYSPDLRYVKGDFYILGESGITFIRLSNYGHSAAEDIRINIQFNKLIKEISLNDKLIILKNIDGGIGTQSYTGEITRLVPSQEALIYFSIDYKSIIPHESPQISSMNIMHKGGFAKTGDSPLYVYIAFSFALTGALLSLITLFWVKRTKYQEKKDFYDQVMQLCANYNFSGKEKLMGEIEKLRNRLFD